jgi:archaemetzincin
MIRSITVIAFLVAVGGAGSLYWLSKPEEYCLEEARATLSRTAELELQQIKVLAGRLESLQQPLCKPEDGDWLEQHTEKGQTFSEFLESRPAPLAKELTTLYLKPIGVFTKNQEKLMAATAQGLELFYGRKVVTLPTVPLSAIPKNARRIHSGTRELQILTTYVLYDILKPSRPKDAIAVLALTAPDLWPGENWNFVFGQASLTERVGVWSIARFGNPDIRPVAYDLYLERMLGTALHETGHMLGIHHCTSWNCCMNGSNNLEESDRHPLWFCAECQPKVWWACGLNPAEQTARLAKFAEEHRLKAAAEHWKAMEQKLKATP